MDVCIIGAGFVGVTTAVSLAERGHAIRIVEKDPRRLAALEAGRLAFHEPGLEDAWRAVMAAGKAAAVPSLDRVARADVAFLCVGTPPRPDGSADLSHVEQAAAELAAWVRGDPTRAPVVVTKSTVPPGTARDIVAPRFAGLPPGRASVASNPEFLREGSALQDAREPDRIVIGTWDERAEAALRELYAGFGCPVVATDPDTAETTKYVANAFLATKVAFSNEVANLCERLGVHVDEVMKGVGLDPRIGALFLRSGLGFGGSCFPKDVAALRSVAQERAVELGILDAVLRNNEVQPLRAIELARELVGPLKGKRVALLGLAFKAHTSDVRETRALPIYRALVAEGADVTCCDPIAGEEFRALAGDGVRIVADARAALVDQDVAIVQTEWPEFKGLTAQDFRRMRRPAVVDGRRALDGRALLDAGIEYRALGVGTGVKR